MLDPGCIIKINTLLTMHVSLGLLKQKFHTAIHYLSPKSVTAARSKFAPVALPKMNRVNLFLS